MRRYTSLLVTAFLLLIVVVLGSGYLAVADHDGGKKPLREITVYTSLPTEVAVVLSEAYESASGVRVNFVPLGQEEILGRLKAQAEGEGHGQAAPTCLNMAIRCRSGSARQRVTGSVSGMIPWSSASIRTS